MEQGLDYIGVGCGALILNEREEALLLKRKTKSDIGLWNQPGGAVEFGETVEDAVRREIREEVGVEIELIRPLGFTNHLDRQDGRSIHWVALYYLAKIASGEPKNLEPEKHEELRWFPLDALPADLARTTRESVEHYRASKG